MVPGKNLQTIYNNDKSWNGVYYFRGEKNEPAHLSSSAPIR